MNKYLVLPQDDGRLLKSILLERMMLSTSAMKNLKWHGEIRVNGILRNVRYPVTAGDTIELLYPSSEPVYLPEPWDHPVNIVYEDEWLIVIDKPAPMPSTSGSGKSNETLENALFFHDGCPDDFVYRPINRLDKGTSGLMIAARDAWSQQLLQKALHSDSFVRTYLAVVEGTPEPAEGVIRLPIAKEDAASVRRIISPTGKPAVTHYHTEESGRNGRSLVRLRLETGRTHQIRVHMASTGHPVTGDFLYGTEIR